MSAYDGRDCAVSFAVQPETTSIGSLSWTTLGMMRTKSLKTDWDTSDTTADSTLNAGKTAIATRKSTTFSGDGVAYDDVAYNQKTLKAQFFNPGATTQYQPKAWLKLEYPDGDTFVGPFIITSWSDDNADAEAMTFSFEATINGSITYTPI